MGTAVEGKGRLRAVLTNSFPFFSLLLDLS